MDRWDHKDEWRRQGKHFLVSVTRHFAPVCRPDQGPHRWAVYAFIYPNHPLFDTFHGEEMFQPASNALPLHWGPTFLRQHRGDDGQICSIQVGADYNHLHDDRFCDYATADDAIEVFNDADELFEYLGRVPGVTHE